jgi:hypothetical protein
MLLFPLTPGRYTLTLSHARKRQRQTSTIA